MEPYALKHPLLGMCVVRVGVLGWQVCELGGGGGVSWGREPL